MTYFCIHYTSLMVLEKQRQDCNAGINVRQLVGEDSFGWITRMPCNPDNHQYCDKYEAPTQEVIDAKEAAMEKRIKAIALVSPIVTQVKKDHKGTAWQGVVECPICDGNLHLSHAKINGHVWGSCETEGCLRWME